MNLYLHVDQTTHLEDRLADNIRHSRAVIKVEMCDEHQVYTVQINGIKVGQRLLSRKARMDATVEHDRLSPARGAQDDVKGETDYKMITTRL